MITEHYVSFEVSKLLKENGFDSEDCFAFYNEYREIGFLQTFGDIADYDSETCVIAPTLQMAVKWMEIEKHIAIIPVLSSILDNEKFLWEVKIVIAETGEKYSQCWVYEDRERACEAAIKYCLENLI